MGVVDDDAIGVHACNFGSEEFNVGDDLFLEVKTDVACVGTVGSLDGGGDEFMELVVINAPVVGSVGAAEDCVGDVRAHFVGDGFSGAFFCTDNPLVDLVDAVSFVLCISMSDESQEHGVLRGPCCICDGLQASLMTDLMVAALVERMQEKRDGGVVMLLLSSFDMMLPGSPRLYVLLSMRQTPMMNVVMVSWVYWLLELDGSASLLILLRSLGPVWWRML